MGTTGDPQGPTPNRIRVSRLAAELRMRRRRLDTYRRSPSWPGKQPALQFELARYDRYLLLAAEMLQVPTDESAGTPLAPEMRAVLEDRLAHAGLDVMEARRGTGDVLQDGELFP